MNKKTPWIEILSAALALVLFVVICYAGGTALLPDRPTFGAGWMDYCAEQRDTVDVLVLGSSRAYCNLMPAEIYAQAGLSAYVMAGPSQTAALTRCYLEQALETQSPRCVVYEISNLFYRQYEDFSLANAIYMPISRHRVDAAMQCEPELRSAALFPLEHSHHYLFERSAEEPSSEDRTMLCGYTPLRETAAQTPTPIASYLASRADALTANLSQLDQIAALCRERNIPLICLLAPSNWVYDEADLAWLRDVLAERGLDAVLWQDQAEAFGINAETDWYDAIHLNVGGAKKLSARLAELLTARGVRSAGRFDPALWARRTEYFADTAS